MEALETRQLLSLIVVNTAQDENAPDTLLTLREAIEVSNGTLPFSALTAQQQQPVFLSPNSTSTDIKFAIPASTATNLDVPVPGFDLSTQDWTITLNSPLPAITSTVSIDGYTEGNGGGVPYLYPASSEPVYIHSIPNTTDALDGNNAEQRVIIDGSAIGGGTGFAIDASHCLLRGLIIKG